MNDFWDDFWEIMRFIGIIITVFIVIMGLGLGVNKLQKISCEKTAESIGKTWKYSFWTPCLIKENGQWIDINNRMQVYGVEK